MKFLCLHGAGTSASILESQTASFRALLSPFTTHSFTFISGPIISAPAAGISRFYGGPYHRFYPSPPQPSAVRAAHAWLREYMAANGPFDALLGFSQGSGLIASWLLYEPAEVEAAGVRAAVFICGGAPLSVLEELGVEITEEARAWDQRSRVELGERAAGRKAAEGGGRWEIGNWGPEDDVEGGNVFGIDFAKVKPQLRIRIPTVHVYGSRDPRYPSSRQLVALSEKENRRVFDTGGGHHIPKNKEVSEGIVELLEWCADVVEGEGR